MVCASPEPGDRALPETFGTSRIAALQYRASLRIGGTNLSLPGQHEALPSAQLQHFSPRHSLVKSSLRSFRCSRANSRQTADAWLGT